MLKREKWLSISILAHILFNPHFLSLVRLDDVFKLQHHTLKKKKKMNESLQIYAGFIFSLLGASSHSVKEAQFTWLWLSFEKLE